MITLRLLGPPELQIDGRPAPPELHWRKNLGLLAYLHCAPARGVTRAQLTELFWGDRPEGAARHSLNEALRVLRRGLGDAAVTTQGDRVRLAGPLDSDLTRLQAALAANDHPAAAGWIGGEFLEGLEIPGASGFHDWLTATRVEWRRRGGDLLAAEAERQLDRGNVAGAVDLGERACQLDPSAVRAVAAVMRASALLGDRASALGHLDRLLAVLEESGLPAPAAIIQLAGRVRAGRTALPAGGSGVDRSRRVPLTGRSAELGLLMTEWRSAAQGGARLGLVVGEPGMGKSRLVEEVVDRARLEGATVALVRAVPADVADSEGTLRALAAGALLEAPGVSAAPAAALATLAEVHPAWAERFPGVRGSSTHSLRRAIVELIRASAGDTPMVLAVDDAQWLDPASRDAIFGLLRDLAEERLFVLLAASTIPSSPDVDHAMARIGRDLPGAAVHLGPLPLDALTELVRSVLPAHEADQVERVARRIALDAGGLPLLAVELLHAVVGGLDLGAADQLWPAPNRTLDHTRPGELPDAIVAAIRIDFRRLSPAAQQAMAAAAVLGERVAAEAIGRASGLDGDLLFAALDELEWNRWLQAELRGYTPVARIVREVVCRDLVTAGQRQRLEARAGLA